MKTLSRNHLMASVLLLTTASLTHANDGLMASALSSPAPVTAASVTHTGAAPVLTTPSMNTAVLTTISIPLYASASKTDTLDVTDIDQKLGILEEKAKHYPTRYTDKAERRGAESRIKALVKKLDEYAAHPDASFEVLMRAMKANQMARNLDVGTESALKAGVYMRRAIALKPADMEANFWYGCMLAEGGGMKEGIPYLNKAAQAGSHKAYVALARAYLSLDKRDLALKSLENFKKVNTSDGTLAQSLIEEVRAGKTDVPW